MAMSSPARPVCALLFLILVVAGAQARSISAISKWTTRGRGALEIAKPPKSSSVWGRQGEKHDPAKGRIVDYSYAGYGAGEVPFPPHAFTASVMDYGAAGDGVTDDTVCFEAAIDAAKDGDVLHIPTGRYLITRRLMINVSLSLIGDGNSSVIVFNSSMTQLYGNTYPDGKSQWAFNGSFITYTGTPFLGPSTFLSKVNKPASRGSNMLQVESTSGILVGQWVVLSQGEAGGTGLFLDLNLGLDKGCTSNYCNMHTRNFTFATRIAKIQSKGRLTLERPLPYNVSTAWMPTLHRWAPRLSNVAVQGLRLEFPSHTYAGHFKEDGYNALEMNWVANSYVKNVHVHNADQALRLWGVMFMTVTGFRTTEGGVTPCDHNTTGHHGIFLTHAVDTLVTNFSIEQRFQHDLTAEFFSQGVVFSQGSGTDLNLDSHGGQTYAILWSNLNLGAGTRPLKSGGAPNTGLHAGTWTTYWNIQAANPEDMLKLRVATNYGPGLNFIGFGNKALYPAITDKFGSSWLIDKIAPERLNPQDLFVAQRSLRMSSGRHVSVKLGGKGRGGPHLR